MNKLTLAFIGLLAMAAAISVNAQDTGTAARHADYSKMSAMVRHAAKTAENNLAKSRRRQSPAARYRIKASGPIKLLLHAYAKGNGEPSHTFTASSDNPLLEEMLEDTLFIGNDTLAINISRYPSAFDSDEMYLVDLYSNLNSSYSSFYLENNPNASEISSNVEQFNFNGRTYIWTASSGTSMACPIVAGTLALWLQAKPTLTRTEVLDIFKRTCKQPEAALSYPNNQYGYGENDAYRGLLDLLGISKIGEVSLQLSAVGVSLHDGQLILSFTDIPSSSVELRLYSLSGTLCFHTIMSPTANEVSLSLPSLPEAVYALQLNSNDQKIAGSHLIRLKH